MVDVILITDNDERLREKYVHQETLEISIDHFSYVYLTQLYIYGKVTVRIMTLKFLSQTQCYSALGCYSKH